MKIRKATERDHERIAELYKEGFSEEPYNESWTIEKAVNKIRLFSSYCEIYVAVEEGIIIGFIVVNPNHWCSEEIIFGEEMVVDKEFRRKGVAKKLLTHIENEYKHQGFTLMMGVVNKNSKSYELTKDLGFNESKLNIIIEKSLK